MRPSLLPWMLCLGLSACTSKDDDERPSDDTDLAEDSDPGPSETDTDTDVMADTDGMHTGDTGDTAPVGPPPQGWFVPESFFHEANFGINEAGEVVGVTLDGVARQPHFSVVVYDRRLEGCEFRYSVDPDSFVWADQPDSGDAATDALRNWLAARDLLLGFAIRPGEYTPSLHPAGRLTVSPRYCEVDPAVFPLGGHLEHLGSNGFRVGLGGPGPEIPFNHPIQEDAVIGATVRNPDDAGFSEDLMEYDRAVWQVTAVDAQMAEVVDAMGDPEFVLSEDILDEATGALSAGRYRLWPLHGYIY